MEGGFFVWNNKRMIRLLKAGKVCYMVKAMKFYLYFYEKFKLGKRFMKLFSCNNYNFNDYSWGKLYHLLYYLKISHLLSFIFS